MAEFSDLHNLIQQTDQLNLAEKELFAPALMTLSQPQQKLLCELFSEEPDLISFMYKNFKKKRDNLNNPDAWDEIVKEELDFLKSAYRVIAHGSTRLTTSNANEKVITRIIPIRECLILVRLNRVRSGRGYCAAPGGS